MKVALVTGCVGFIGFHISKKLLENNFKIIGIDNLNSYYSTSLKKKRLNILKNFKKFQFFKIDLSNFLKLKKQINISKIDYVLHFAAQAGVRHSLKKPREYLNSNPSDYPKSSQDQDIFRFLEAKFHPRIKVDYKNLMAYRS